MSADDCAAHEFISAHFSRNGSLIRLVLASGRAPYCKFLSVPLGTGPKNLPESLDNLAPSTVEHIEDFTEIVVPITSVKIIPSAKLNISRKPSPKLDLGANFGMGFCLDAACRLSPPIIT